MVDARRLLDQFLGARGGGLGGKAAIATSLAGLLLGSRRGARFGGGGFRAGGMAAIAGLAYRAYQDWQAAQTSQGPQAPQASGGFTGNGAPARSTGGGGFLSGAGAAGFGTGFGTSAGPAARTDPPTAPPGSPFDPADDGEKEELARALIRAMIAAAKADGHIDATEQARIFAELDRLPLDADDRAFVMDEIRAPLDVERVAAGARSEVQAAEIYAASLLAIDVDSPAERGYLALLAARLNLPDALVRHLGENVHRVQA